MKVTAQIKYLAASIGLLAGAAQINAAYDPNYTKGQAGVYSWHGLYELYDFGGDLGWINDDSEGSASVEGVDCSSYVARVLALPSFVPEFVASTHPLGTVHFYPGVANTVQVNDATSAPFDLWVWRASAGGPSEGHTGIVRTKDTSTITTREAQSHQSGYDILPVTRNRQTLIDYNTRYWRRANWGSDANPRPISINSSQVTASAHSATGLPKYSVDGAISQTTYWAAQGSGQWIKFDLLVANVPINYVKIAWYSGNTRRQTFSVQVSNDDTNWTTVLNRVQSSGTTTALETWDFADVNARYVRVIGYGNTANDWNSMTEIEVWTTLTP
ncbi:MAG: discoidin domain-containing protein [Opitutae bacterium]|nr:discoidin domain-containing protein [Opitutae bacterium]